MKLWNRIFRMQAGRTTEASAALVDVHRAVNSMSDYGYSLWETVVGPTNQFGASALCSDVEEFFSGAPIYDYPDAEALGATAAAVKALVAGPAEDSLWSIVHALGDWSSVPNVLSDVISEVRMDQMGPALEATVEFAEYMHGLTGTPVTVCTSFWGTGPSVRMYWGYESMGDWDERTTRGTADPGFHQRNAALAALPGTGMASRSGVFRRLG
jgi:hypothetical protein